MNTADLMLFFELQKLNSASQIGSVNDNRTSMNPADAVLFMAMLQSAMGQNAGSGIEENQSKEFVSQSQQGQKVVNDNLNPNTNLEDIIISMSRKHGVDPNIIREVIRAESGFNAQAVSSAGAKGLMQLMPGTASSYGVNDVFNPEQNIDGGTHFLRDLLNRYNGNVSLALAAYNAGPGAVNKYHGIPPYSETRNYVSKIISRLNGVEYKA